MRRELDIKLLILNNKPQSRIMKIVYYMQQNAKYYPQNQKVSFINLLEYTKKPYMTVKQNWKECDVEYGLQWTQITLMYLLEKERSQSHGDLIFWKRRI